MHVLLVWQGVAFNRALGLQLTHRFDSFNDSVLIYNGIVFEGFVAGVPSCVLSGGQYDKLMAQMGKDAQAIGFAVYVDVVEQYFDKTPAPSVDVIVLYGDDDNPLAVYEAVQRQMAAGNAVLATREVLAGMRYAAIQKVGGNDA